MHKVAVVQCSSYEESQVKEAVCKTLDLLGGLESFVKPASKVLLKPNLLLARNPEGAVTTHPQVLKVLIEEIKSIEAIPLVGDSPGGRNTQKALNKIFRETGIGKVCQETGTQIIIFDQEVIEAKNPDGKTFKRFEIAKIYQEVDVIINLPKLKTHGFMTLTGAVKNIFGFIPGVKKAQFHLKVPQRENFAQMLVDLNLLIRPHLSLMDAVVAMDGEGPSGGNPRNLGLILASRDPFALDFVVAQVCNIAPSLVPTVKKALEMGLIKPDLIEILGLSLEEVLVKDFVLPSGSVMDRVPSFIFCFARNQVTPKPQVDALKCTGCKTCYENCPSNAIEMRENIPHFDYDVCIRCYCCQELCPESAINLYLPILSKIFS